MNRVLESIFQRMLCSAIITLSLPFLASGQQQDRVVDWQPVRIMSEARVLEIVDITVDGMSIAVGQPFTANEDWLNTLTFKVRNISDKPIKIFGFGIAFPELNANGRIPGLSIVYGADPTKNDSNARKTLMPDEEVDLKLPEEQLEIMRRVSTNHRGTANFSKVNILPGLITFEDGSRIDGISLRRQIPENP